MKKKAFTIVELLTVMSIIIILISLLIPSVNMVRRIAREVVQRNQFRNIATGLQMFESDFEEYPDSSRFDVDIPPAYYPGAMKLCEVMAGQDGLGYHLDSRLCINGLDASVPPKVLYPDPLDPDTLEGKENLRSRKEYLEAKDIQVCTLTDLYDPAVTDMDKFPDPDAGALLCDVFRSVRSRFTGKRMGMPVLYYRADPSRLLHDPTRVDTTICENIYNSYDNMPLLELGIPPGDTGEKPPLFLKEVFYENTQDPGVMPIVRPHNKDSYILISAGWDGIYGSRDDIYNFAK